MDPDTLAANVRAKVDDLQRRLLAKVDANLSGGILQARSGTLRASIAGEITEEAGVIKSTVASRGVVYAVIQEFGGTTSPHEIVPVKAQALAFAGGSGKIFARRVNHPGSVVPAHAYLGGALDDLQNEIFGGLKQSVLDALGVG